jgi:Bacterial transcription activator, effector binding domain.
MEKKTVEKVNVLCISLDTTLKSMINDAGNLPNELVEKALELNLEITGPQIWVYDTTDGNPNTPFELTISLPVNKSTGDAGKFRFAEFPEFNCISEIHKGPWAKLGETYQKLMPSVLLPGQSCRVICREVYHICDFENQENCVTEIQVEV